METYLFHRYKYNLPDLQLRFIYFSERYLQKLSARLEVNIPELVVETWGNYHQWKMWPAYTGNFTWSIIYLQLWQLILPELFLGWKLKKAESNQNVSFLYMQMMDKLVVL